MAYANLWKLWVTDHLLADNWHPLFWFMALLFGAGLGSITQTLVWIVIVFISILVHELGHTFAMRRYGQDAMIVLYLGGGLAIPTSGRWGYNSRTANEQIIISLAGPFAGQEEPIPSTQVRDQLISLFHSG